MKFYIFSIVILFCCTISQQLSYAHEITETQTEILSSCTVPVKVLNLDKSGCSDLPKNTLCKTTVEMRAKKRLCDYINGQNFSLDGVLLSSELIKKTKSGVTRQLLIEKIQQCVYINKDDMKKRLFCQKRTRHFIK